jgi:hypothetical protein
MGMYSDPRFGTRGLVDVLLEGSVQLVVEGTDPGMADEETCPRR